MIAGTVGRRGGRAALWLVVGLLVGGTVGAGATYLIKRGKSGIPGGPRLGAAEELALVPADASGFVHLRLRDLWHLEEFKEVRKIIEKAGPPALATLDEGFVPAPSSIDRMTLVFFKTPRPAEAVPAIPAPKLPPKGPHAPRKNAQRGKGGFAPPPPPPPLPQGGGFDDLMSLGGEVPVVVVLAFSAPYDAEKVRTAYLPKGEKKSVGTREYWDDPHSSFAAYFPDDTKMVLGDGAGMKLYLSRLNNTDGPLASALEHAREGSRHIVAALNVSQFGIGAALLGNLPADSKDAPKHAQAILKAETAMLGLALGEEPRLDIRIKYKDGAAAAESEAALRELAKLGREKLVEPKKQMEALLNGPPNGPKPRPIENLPRAVAGLFGLGSLNSLDEFLADPPLETKDSEVILAPKMTSLATVYAASISASLAMLVPAMEKVQISASRTKDSNNLKQLGIAMHAFHDVYGFLPAQDGKIGPNTKGGLSWRVHILPFIEQNNLYLQFHLDEPWDSEHNKTLIDKMPVTYASPFATDPPGQTRYKVFSGPDAVIFPGSRTKMLDIFDGTSNTIMIVGGGKPVTWTKPEDLPFTGAGVAPAVLELPGQTGCNIAMCDGSVAWFELNRLTPERLKAAITRAGGEVIFLDP